MAKSALNLRLTVALSDGDTRDIMVTIPPEQTVKALVAALVTHFFPENGPRDANEYVLFSSRGNTALSAKATIEEVQLLTGDFVSLMPDLPEQDPLLRESSPKGQVYELAVVGGPLTGTRYTLDVGSHTVGRDPQCDVSLDDSFISATHIKLELRKDEVTIADAGSHNGTFIHGMKVTEERQVSVNDIIEVGQSLLKIKPVSGAKSTPLTETIRLPSARLAALTSDTFDGRIHFNRPPRVLSPEPNLSFSLPAAPSKPPSRRLPLGASIVPLIFGGAMAFVPEPNRLQYLGFAALSPIMALWSFVDERRSGRRDFRKAEQKFTEAIAELTAKLGRLIGELSERQIIENPDPGELLQRAATLDPNLWVRRSDDADFLRSRVGWGDLDSGIRIDVDGKPDELPAEVSALRKRFAVLPSSPLTITLPEAGVTGVCGDPGSVNGTGRWIATQIATLHSPEDVQIAAILSPDGLELWSCMTWLPHVLPDRSTVSTPQFAISQSDTGALLDALNALVDKRQKDLEAYRLTPGAFLPQFVVFIDHAAKIPRAPLLRLLKEGPQHGIFFVWLGRARRDLPGESGAIVEHQPDTGDVTVTFPRRGSTTTGTGEQVSTEFCEELARLLSPIRDRGARDAASIPRTVSLHDLFESNIDAEQIVNAWRGSNEGLRAVVGQGPRGPFFLDMHSDGPHALLGGTTGSGKSELLQTFIVSLCAAYSPEGVNLILIDYKGGAAFKDCTSLPHVVGFVTDLDGGLAHRALISLEAELKRREEILRDLGVRDLIEAKRRAPESAPPSLLIVIDEFATLTKELPDFVAGMVDVAQRGRSLGVHLVLATQRPAGVITENIKANTNLRIALRVADEADSNDIIGTGDAAHIPRSLPGRGFARTGLGEVQEFQSAYVGGHSFSTEASHLEVVDLRHGRPAPKPQTRAEQGPERPTDLQLIVRSIENASRESKLREPRSPWLPPLPTVVPLESIVTSAARGDVETGIIGLVDRPNQQRQDVWLFDLERDGSLLVYGTSGSGKTTLLRSLAVSLAVRYSPERVNLYGLDFGTRGLDGLQAIPHFGNIIAGSEPERVQRVLTTVGKVIDDRKNLLGQAGVSTLSEYRRIHPGESLPRIVVLLENFSGFSAAFERIDYGEMLDVLPRFVGDSRAVGVHFVITADRRGSVPPALAGVIPSKIVLRLAEEDEYVMLGIDRKLASRTPLPPGRGFVEMGLSLQCAVVGASGVGSAQTATINNLADELSATHPGTRVPSIDVLPRTVHLSSLPANHDSQRPVLGLADDDLQPVFVDPAEGHLLVAGPHRSGRTTALISLGISLREVAPSLDLRLFAPRRSPIADLPIWSSMARGIEQCDRGATALEQLLDQADNKSLPEAVVIIDDAEDLADTADGSLARVTKRSRDLNIWVIVACDTQAAHRSHRGCIAEVKKDRHALVLMPDVDVDGDLAGVRFPRRTSIQFVPGRGYLVRRGIGSLMQVAIEEGHSLGNC